MDSFIFKAFIPEIFLSIVILIQLLFNTKIMFHLQNNFPLLQRELLSQTSFILLITFFLAINVEIEGLFSNFLFINDYSSIIIKIIFLFFILLSLPTIWQTFNVQNINFFEFYTLFLFIVLASLLLVSCFDLFSVYIILEIQALCFYIIAGLKRNSALSTESALKYFIIGSFFSCFFLFGVSLAYGALGTTNFYFLSLLSVIPFNNFFQNINILLFICMLIIIITVFFKLAVVPFHFWVPDVYDGAPLSSTIVFSILPKMMLITFLTRFLLINYQVLYSFDFFFNFLGVLSIAWGAFFALKQKRLKKFFIFSSISQIGFIIITFANFSEITIMSNFFFLIVYNITSIIGWNLLSSLYLFNKQQHFFKKDIKTLIYLSSLKNLFYTNKSWAFIFIFFLFSIAGLPPFIGFFGKFFIFFSLIKTNNFIFILFLMFITSISAFYYIRLLKIIFFEIKVKSIINTFFYGNFLYLYKDLIISIICFCLFLLLVLFFSFNNILLFSKFISIGFFRL